MTELFLQPWFCKAMVPLHSPKHQSHAFARESARNYSIAQYLPSICSTSFGERLLWIFGLSVFLFAADAYAQMPPDPELQRLHDVLNLRPDQDTSWQDYVRSTAVDPQEVLRRRDASERIADLTAPERVDLSVQMMKADLASLQRRAAALKIFYDSLTPEQKVTFDEETTRAPRQRM